MRSKAVELVVGLFVIAGIVSLVALAFKVSGFVHYSSSDYYEVSADFDNIGGLKPRAKVAVSGVVIGQVEKISLDPKSYLARATLLLNKHYKVPRDSEASIFTEGILGSNYISIAPGYDRNNLQAGGIIEKTHSAMILENLIGQLVYSFKGDGDKDKSTDKNANTDTL